VAGLAVGLAGALQDGALAPVAGGQRTLLSYLLLAGWVGMTVAGSLLHLLMVLARVRGRLGAGAPLPAPRALRDNAIVWTAAVAVIVGAVARSAGLDALMGPAHLALTAVAVATAGLMAAEISTVLRSLRSRPGAPGKRPAGGPGAAAGPSAGRPAASAASASGPGGSTR
jgi:hypothetical protein